jgi:hypothetical protein
MSASVNARTSTAANERYYDSRKIHGTLIQQRNGGEMSSLPDTVIFFFLRNYEMKE